VLIDEVDEHLHPSWQKTILDGLCKAFPRAQFFVTTHSSIVLASVKDTDAKVWQLKDGEILERGPLYGKTSDVILSDYQDTPLRPKELQDLIDKARSLLRQSKPDDADALITQITDLTEDGIPDLVGLRQSLQMLRHRLANPVPVKVST
jgi:predicted ATP-binding protein involved in virulence